MQCASLWRGAFLCCEPFLSSGHRIRRIPGGKASKERRFLVAYMKKHCSGCCSGCNNCHAQVNCSNGCSRNRGCGCRHHSCGSCSSCHSGCSSCSSCNSGRNSFGALRSVSGPFSNCGNWWNHYDCFPYYTGPCGPCDPCEQCCCKEWPWPWPPFMPVNNGCAYPYSSEYHTRDNCGHDHKHTDYTSNKNCYQTEASHHEACASRRVKPIVDCTGCRHDCGD